MRVLMVGESVGGQGVRGTSLYLSLHFVVNLELL